MLDKQYSSVSAKLILSLKIISEMKSNQFPFNILNMCSADTWRLKLWLKILDNK
jgi:hypothetical protein